VPPPHAVLQLRAGRVPHVGKGPRESRTQPSHPGPDGGRAVASAKIWRIRAEGYVERDATPCANSIGSKAPSWRLLRIVGKLAQILSNPIRSLILGFCTYAPVGTLSTILW